MATRSFILLGIILLITSCNLHKREDAMKLNNELAAINDSLYYIGRNWNEELKIAVNTKDFTGLPAVRLQMDDYIKNKIEYVSKMRDVGGSEELRKAELHFLQFEKSLISHGFQPFESFTDSSTDEQITEAYKALLQQVGDEQEHLANLSKLQDDYAEKNDFPKPIRP